MLTKAVPFVATLLGAISCAAHATPIELGDAALDRIVASDGSGNGNGNVGNNNGNNNSGNNNGNSNVGNNNGNNNSGSNNGNNNADSGNGNNNSTDGNGNGAPDPRAAPEEVLRDMLRDIITFDDGGAVADVLPAEVELRIYRARLALAKAEDEAAKAERLERKIERLAAEHAEAAAAAERKRRNGVTRKDLDFVFFSGDDAPNPKRGLQRIVDRGFILYGNDASRFAKFSDRLRSVIFD